MLNPDPDPTLQVAPDPDPDQILKLGIFSPLWNGEELRQKS
jgi:hypothetical protein